MHILFILDHFYPYRGGAETVFENIIKRLSIQGYEITILTSHFDLKLKKHDQLDWGGEENIKIYRTGKGRYHFMRKAFRLGKKILKKNSDIKIIHTSTYGGAIPAWFLAKRFSKKILLTVHEVFGKLRLTYKGGRKGRIFLLIEKIIFKLKYDAYHTVSLYTKNSLRLLYQIPDPKLFTIYNGVDYDFRSSKNVSHKTIQNIRKKYGWHHDKVFLYYGHSGKSKGLDFLIQAIPDIVQNNPDDYLIFNLILAQRDFQCRQDIDAQIQKLPKDLQGHVQVFGGFEMKDLRDLVASVDLVIAPSLSEGFGSVHTETIAMQKILITTDIGPLPEVLGGKVLFIRPQDSNAISEAIKLYKSKKIHNLPEKYFSRDDTVKGIINLFRFLAK